MLMADTPPQKSSWHVSAENASNVIFRQEANVRVHRTAGSVGGVGKSLQLALIARGGGGTGSRGCVRRRRRRTVKNAAVEPSWALINNLLIYRSLSLKRRLQATEGCQQRRWRRADKTHSGGLLSARRLAMEAIHERAQQREDQTEGNKEKHTHTRRPLDFSVYI